MTSVDRPEPRPYPDPHHRGRQRPRPDLDRPELPPTPVDPGVAAREATHRRRLARRVPLGAALGAIAGGALGAILGAIAFAPGGAIMASTIAGAVALGVLGGFWGGMASLESTDAGAEPTQAAEPLDTRGVSEESDVAAPPTSLDARRGRRGTPPPMRPPR